MLLIVEFLRSLNSRQGQKYCMQRYGQKQIKITGRVGTKPQKFILNRLMLTGGNAVAT